MAGQQLPTIFLQISDLHIDDNLHAPGQHFQDAEVQKHIKVCPWFGKGLLGHHGRAVSALRNFYSIDLRRLAHETLVTGDFTRNGGPAQLSQARLLLDARAGGNCVKFGISGNHDHWAGINWPWGGPAIAIQSEFKLPRVEKILLPGWPPLQLILINTDAEVPPKSWRRWWARATFIQELKAAESALQKTGEFGIRVLLLHHPWQYKGYICGMPTSSRDALQKFIVQHKISVVLSGHIHKAQIKKDTLSDGNNKWQILEACCGTTTQLDRISTRWPQWLVPKLEANSLIVHELQQHNSSLHWHANIYIRGANGFQLSKKTADRDGIAVWPV